METKRCSRCGEVKGVDEFYKRKAGFRSSCKSCMKKSQNKYSSKNKDKAKEYWLDNKDKIKQYRLENKDNILEYAKKYRLENKDKAKEYYLQNRDSIVIKRKQYRLENKDKKSSYNKRYFAENKDKIAKYRTKKRKNDPMFKLECNLRSRIIMAVKAQSSMKAKKSTELLGCTPQQVREYLESQFTEGMSWANHGKYWEIDHIKPCASFDMTDVEQQKICFHYSNLQPLTVKDNRSKSDKLDWVKLP